MKKITFPTSIFLSFWLTLLGCSTMPKERPADFSIRLSDHGGMMPAGYSIELSDDSSYVEYYVFDARNKVPFQISTEELDHIYKLCVKQKFDIIKEKKEMVYDRGGTSISINANGKDIRKSDAGTSFIKGKHAKRFNMVEGMIRKMARDKTADLKRKIEVIVEDSLLTENTFLHLDVNKGGFSSFRFNSEKEGKQKSIEVPFYEGSNHVSVNWVEAGEQKHRRQSIAANKFTIQIADSTQQLYLLKRGEELVLEIKGSDL